LNPDVLIALVGVLTALTAALVKMTWTLSSRLARLETELAELARRLGVLDDTRQAVAQVRERLAVLEAEHKRFTGPGGRCGGA